MNSLILFLIFICICIAIFANKIGRILSKPNVADKQKNSQVLPSTILTELIKTRIIQLNWKDCVRKSNGYESGHDSIVTKPYKTRKQYGMYVTATRNVWVDEQKNTEVTFWSNSGGPECIISVTVNNKRIDLTTANHIDLISALAEAKALQAQRDKADREYDRQMSSLNAIEHILGVDKNPKIDIETKDQENYEKSLL